MLGDIWTSRTHGGPGFRGWVRRQISDMISLIKRGRHVPVSHTAIELEGGMLLDTGKRVRLVYADTWLEDPYRSVYVHRIELEPQQREAIFNQAIKLTGKRYSYMTALGHVVARWVAGAIAKLNDEDVICSEAVALVMFRGIGFRFKKRHGSEYLDPERCRPRDIWSTIAHDTGAGKIPWTLVKKTAHGRLYHGTA